MSSVKCGMPITVPYLDFSFIRRRALLIFTAPKPRYERIILARDQLGRIVHSKLPQSQI